MVIVIASSDSDIAVDRVQVDWGQRPCRTVPCWS